MFTRDVLDGKRILVTGGGTGLGKEMSVGFAAHGAHVFICGRRQDVLDQAVGEIRTRSGGRADAFVANVRDSESIDAMMSEIWATRAAHRSCQQRRREFSGSDRDIVAPRL